MPESTDIPAGSLRPFNIMCKPVCGVCNLDCAYCYYTMKPRELYPDVREESAFRMSDATLESYTRQYLDAMPVRAEFGWQGGEPTLAGLDFFRRAVDLQQQYKRPMQQIGNALQTNATLLDDAWCEFLAANQFLVGTSLDGPPQWHDFYRKDRAGAPTYHRAWAGLELARARGVETNVLVTLNSVNAPHAGDIYRYFTNLGVQYVQFIPILERMPDGSPTAFSCTPEQFGRFCLEVFDLWASRDIGRVSERLIDSVLHALIFGKASTCCYAERCANSHIVEWNGDFYVCDHFVYPEWKVGNIHETPLAELVQHPRLEEFAALKTDLPAACRDCEFQPYCFGGCPKHHMPLGQTPNPDRVNYFCDGYKLFFREALPELKRMAEYFGRNETPPLKAPDVEGKSARVAARAAEETRAAQYAAGPGAQATQPQKVAAGAGPVGRNDPCPCGSGRKYKRCCGR